MGDATSSERFEEPSDFGGLKPGWRLGRYELLVPIARGGMARVWAARLHGQRGFQKLVALKTILPELAHEGDFERMFLDEARIASGIHHPNVCETYELGEAQGTLYLAMEWINGDSLSRVIGTRGPDAALDARVGARLVADVCAGLHAAHELVDDDGWALTVVHRDLTPHNILLTTDGIAKICDFGVAKAIGQLQAGTRAGHIKGKLAYMPAEQITGGFIDRRSDVFSVGVVLYEVTTGQRPFRGEGDAQLMHAVLESRFAPPSAFVADYPSELEEIVMRALARDPAARYATAEEMRFALEEYLARGPLVTQANIAKVVQARLSDVLDRRRERIRKASDGDGYSRSYSPLGMLTPSNRSGVVQTNAPPAATPPVSGAVAVAAERPPAAAEAVASVTNDAATTPPVVGKSTTLADDGEPLPSVADDDDDDAGPPDITELMSFDEAVDAVNKMNATLLDPPGERETPVVDATLALPAPVRIASLEAMAPAAPADADPDEAEDAPPSSPTLTMSWGSVLSTLAAAPPEVLSLGTTLPVPPPPLATPLPVPPPSPVPPPLATTPPSEPSASKGPQRRTPSYPSFASSSYPSFSSPSRPGAAPPAHPAFAATVRTSSAPSAPPAYTAPAYTSPGSAPPPPPAHAVLPPPGQSGYGPPPVRYQTHSSQPPVEMPVRPAPHGRVALAPTIIAAVIGALAASLVFAGAHFVQRSRAPATPIIVVTAPLPSAAPVAPEPIALHVSSPDARLTVDGVDLAPSERSVPRPLAGKSAVVVVHAKGFEDTTIRLDANTPSSIDVTLAPVAEPHAPPADSQTPPAQ